MNDAILNRNQMNIGPGIFVDAGLYKRTWGQGDHDDVIRFTATVDIRGKRRNMLFDNKYVEYPDPQIREYFNPELHHISNMSGNKKRHNITFFLLNGRNGVDSLNRMINLAADWDHERMRRTNRYWEDERYRAYIMLSDVPDTNRIFTEQIDQAIEPEHAVQRKYFEIFNRILDFAFYMNRII